MSSQYGNDSYSRCIAELRARYSGRGVSVSVRKNAEDQVKKEEQTRENTSETYYLFDSRSGIANRYRSGEYNGSKYMTSDDFVRYFRSRRPYSMPGRAEASVAEQNTNGVVGVDRSTRAVASGKEKNPDSGSKEGHLKTALLTFINKWLPVESKEGRTTGTKFRLPAAAMGSIAVFALSLGLIVSGSVMIGKASASVGELNTEISVLEARRADLEGQLDLKYDMEEIKAEAESLGMVQNKYVGGEYLDADSHEKSEIYEQEEKQVGLAALLSAFGIRFD